MACFPDETLIACNEGGLGAIEAARVRDHLLLCPACRETAARYRLIERALEQPQLANPPARLVPQVMERLFPAAARVTSIAAVIAASFVFLVSWIYIYFDFSSSSLVQALRLTAEGTTGWLVSIIKGITVVYNGAQAVRKALGAMLRIFFPAPLGFVAIAVAILGLSLLLALTVFRPRPKKAKRP